MSDHMQGRDDAASVPRELRDAVRHLREEMMPTDIWRQRLLHEIAAAPVPRAGDEQRSGRRWSMRPATAVAAGLVCALIGGGAALIAVRPAPLTPTSAAQTATQPRVRFTLVAPTATTVSIVGDFNGWAAGSLPLRRSSDGRTWVIEMPLAPGRYAYSFVVDGQLARDPSAPQAKGDDFGLPNSVVMVSGS